MPVRTTSQRRDVVDSGVNQSTAGDHSMTTARGRHVICLAVYVQMRAAYWKIRKMEFPVSLEQLLGAWKCNKKFSWNLAQAPPNLGSLTWESLGTLGELVKPYGSAMATSSCRSKFKPRSTPEFSGALPTTVGTPCTCQRAPNWQTKVRFYDTVICQM